MKCNVFILNKINKQTVLFKTFLSFSCDHASYSGRHYIFHMIDICHMAGLKEPTWLPICYLVVINCSHLII
jgi:hypothetical protein